MTPAHTHRRAPIEHSCTFMYRKKCLHKCACICVYNDYNAHAHAYVPLPVSLCIDVEGVHTYYENYGAMMCYVHFIASDFRTPVHFFILFLKVFL